MTNKKAAVYVKETAERPAGKNSREVQTQECERHCAVHGLEITARYYDSPGSRLDFQRMMDGATKKEPPFNLIVVRKLRNFSWLLEETVLCRDRLSANGVSLVSTTESSPRRWIP